MQDDCPEAIENEISLKINNALKPNREISTHTKADNHMHSRLIPEINLTPTHHQARLKSIASF